MARPSVNRLARVARRGDEPASNPRPPQMSLHKGWVRGVDIGRNVAGFEFNEPEDLHPSGLVVPGVGFMQAYTADNPPQDGEVAWLQQWGNTVMLLGRHVVPDSTVTAP